MTYCPLITQTLRIISVRCNRLFLEINDMTESNTSAFYLDLLLSIGKDGQRHTSVYDKRDDFNLHITNFPFRSNIPSSPPYGVFPTTHTPGLPPLMNVLFWGRRDSPISFFWQAYVKERLKSSLRKFYGSCGDLIKQYEVPLPWMFTVSDLLPNCQRSPQNICTWSCPTLGLASVLMLRPIITELVLLPTFEFRISLGASGLLWVTTATLNRCGEMVYGSNLPTPNNSRVIKMLYIKICDDIPYIHRISTPNQSGEFNVSTIFLMSTKCH